MLKTAGILLILISSAGLGFRESCRLTCREKTLEMLLRMSVLLKAEIRCQNASLPEAFRGAGRKLPGIWGEFLLETARRAEECPGIRFGEIFRQCAGGKMGQLPLSEEEKTAFFALGENLGYLDMEMQMKQLELYETELLRYLETLRSEIPAKKKMYQSLGVLGGILLAVLVW